MCEFICVCVSEWRIGVRVCVCVFIWCQAALLFSSVLSRNTPQSPALLPLLHFLSGCGVLLTYRQKHTTHTRSWAGVGGEDMQTFEEWPIFNDSQAKMITIWCQYMLLAEIGPFLDPLIVLLLRNTMSTGISLFWPWRSWGKMIMQACNTLMHRP